MTSSHALRLHDECKPDERVAACCAGAASSAAPSTLVRAAFALLVPGKMTTVEGEFAAMTGQYSQLGSTQIGTVSRLQQKACRQRTGSIPVISDQGPRFSAKVRNPFRLGTWLREHAGWLPGPSRMSPSKRHDLLSSNGSACVMQGRVAAR